jgi:uncharacterized protein YciI
MKRFAYFYFMKNDPEKIAKNVAAHIKHWKRSALPDYLGGPFSDRSGGLISFSEESPEEAVALVLNDPFIASNLVEQKWLKEWSVE